LLLIGRRGCHLAESPPNCKPYVVGSAHHTFRHWFCPRSFVFEFSEEKV
jgi:hypothetical protein